MFHPEETGWRECTSCGKRLHCGCIASSSLLELLDTGGVNCKGCSKSSKLPFIPSEDKHEVHGPSVNNGNGQDFDKVVPAQLGDDSKKEHKEQLPPSWKLEDEFAGSGETEYKLSSTLNWSSIGPSKTNGMLQESKGATAVHRSLVQTNLSISLSASSNSNTLSGFIAEERELSSPISSFQQGCRPRHLIPRLPNSILAVGLDSNTSAISQLRVARPPVEGRVKNQLLPRYWPRITDQELQQISGDSNSTIIPLFEKVLSASDAGRIGRLVLPKACAEAYFPAISQPEGLPLRIQDVKGKEWVFQFRFWPNNNSRMYVLEGVTPCIQSMQLQAGDTVTFSRMDPEGKLLMGFRKASNSLAVPKGSHYSMTSGFQGEPSLGNAENIPLMSGYSSLLQSLNAGRHSSLSVLSKHVYAGSTNPHIIENNMHKSGDNLLPQQLLLPERKRRNIGPKSKRLLIDGHDSMELRLSWEEVQDMLHPPPTVKPSMTLIDDHEFEEFEEPPVFAKSSIFIIRQSGEHQQWAECDSCCKWRKIPFDLLLPPKWTCQDNIHDAARSACSAPDELSSRELENLLKMNKEFNEREVPTSIKPMHEHESQKLEALTNTATDMNDQGASSVAATTKHPRHRPGCSCIVCIQPPSGKGKHKPTCMCNVCMTVKRRFKTLMMRKKKRQSEREAEIAQRNQFTAGTEEAEVNSIPDQESSQFAHDIEKSETEIPSRCQSTYLSKENDGKNKGGLDLNCCPAGEHGALPRVSMMSLLHQANLPLETYLRQKGLTSLVADQQATSPIVSQAPGKSTAQAQDEHLALQEREEGSYELSEKDDKENDPS